jgi:uncharacterized protein
MIRKLLLLVCILVTGAAVAQDLPERSSEIVSDLAGMLSASERQALESKLVNFSRTTSTQIAVVTVPDLGGYEIADYAVRLGEKWGIGQKGKNNGILVLVSRDDRKMNISTGYGVEGALTDALSRRIIEKEMKPAFKQGNYYEGLDRATSTIMSLVKGEFTADQYAGQQGRGAKKFPGFLVLLVLGVIALVGYTKVSGVRRYARTNHIPFWVAWSLMSAAASQSRGRWSDFSSGGGSFGGWGGGGGSSGGFGGFGGGSFGGGGASGDW